MSLLEVGVLMFFFEKCERGGIVCNLLTTNLERKASGSKIHHVTHIYDLPVVLASEGKHLYVSRKLLTPPIYLQPLLGPTTNGYGLGIVSMSLQNILPN